MALNSLSLRPNEPRSGISLVEHEQSLDAGENRTLMDRAAALYQTFFTSLYALEQRGVENLIAIPPQKENKEWSSSWVRKHTYDSLYIFLSGQKLLSVGEERRTLCEREMYLVSAKDPKRARP